MMTMWDIPNWLYPNRGGPSLADLQAAAHPTPDLAAAQFAGILLGLVGNEQGPTATD